MNQQDTRISYGDLLIYLFVATWASKEIPQFCQPPSLLVLRLPDLLQFHAQVRHVRAKVFDGF